METFSALLARCARNSLVNSPNKGQRRGALLFSLICPRINGWVNNCEAGDLRCHHAHYGVTVMFYPSCQLHIEQDYTMMNGVPDHDYWQTGLLEFNTAGICESWDVISNCECPSGKIYWIQGYHWPLTLSAMFKLSNCFIRLQTIFHVNI